MLSGGKHCCHGWTPPGQLSAQSLVRWISLFGCGATDVFSWLGGNGEAGLGDGFP